MGQSSALMIRTNAPGLRREAAGLPLPMANFTPPSGCSLRKLDTISTTRRERRVLHAQLRTSPTCRAQTDFDDLTPFLYYIPCGGGTGEAPVSEDQGIDTGITGSGPLVSLLWQHRRGDLSVTDRVVRSLSLPLHSCMQLKSARTSQVGDGFLRSGGRR